jgi:hypothetical protein
MAVIYSLWPINISKFYIPRPSKNTQVGIFDMKKYHLATLHREGERRQDAIE